MVIGDFNAKIDKEEFFRPTTGTESKHEKTNNDNGMKLIGFAAGKECKTACVWSVAYLKQCFLVSAIIVICQLVNNDN